jgi:hypothetical protein
MVIPSVPPRLTNNNEDIEEDKIDLHHSSFIIIIIIINDCSHDGRAAFMTAAPLLQQPRRFWFGFQCLRHAEINEHGKPVLNLQLLPSISLFHIFRQKNVERCHHLDRNFFMQMVMLCLLHLILRVPLLVMLQGVVNRLDLDETAVLQARTSSAVGFWILASGLP